MKFTLLALLVLTGCTQNYSLEDEIKCESQGNVALKVTSGTGSYIDCMTSSEYSNLYPLIP